MFSRGAGSKVWNQVYMIAPVKKFGRVRLSTNFPWKQIWWRMQTWKDDDFLSVLSFPAYKYQEKVSIWTFLMDLLDVRRSDVWTVHGDFPYRDLGSRQVQLFLSFVNFRATILLHLLYFFTYSDIKTLFLILNICYEHNILVWVLQQSYVNVH